MGEGSCWGLRCWTEGIPEVFQVPGCGCPSRVWVALAGEILAQFGMLDWGGLVGVLVKIGVPG